MTFTDTGPAGAARQLFLDGARNAHALEKEAEQLIKRQLDRVESYPQVAQRLRQHLEETKRQEERLERILEGQDDSHSTIKDTMMSLMGNLGALAHAPADDEILKNTFANLAFENYEIAAYKSLITMGEAAGLTREVELLRQSLSEEQDMARWIDDNVETVTREHLALRASGRQADR